MTTETKTVGDRATQSTVGTIYAVEFDDEDGTLLTIRVPSDTRWRAGTVRVEYVESIRSLTPEKDGGE